VHHLKHNPNYSDVSVTVLSGTSLVGKAMLNASRTAETISMRSTREHNMLPSAESSSLATTVTLTSVSRGKLEESIIQGEHLLNVIYVLFGLHFKIHILNTYVKLSLCLNN
jgi:hypothetical protein